MFKRIPVSENFYLDEFVDPYTYFTECDNGLSLIDSKIIDCAQQLRYDYGKGIRINNWWWYYEKYKIELSTKEIIKRIERSKTISKWSGLRSPRSSYYSTTSAHSPTHTGKCLAIDPKSDYKEFYKIIENDPKFYYELGLRRLEDISITPGWLHMDLLERNTKPDSIRIVDRNKSTHTIRW